MGFSAILIVTLAVAVVVVIGGGVAMYFGKLVKIAYDIKIQTNSDIEERLTRVSGGVDGEMTRFKQDLVHDTARVRAGLVADTARQTEEFFAALTRRLAAVEEAVHAERTEWVRAIQLDRAHIGRAAAAVATSTRELGVLDHKLTLASRSSEPQADGTPPETPSP